MARKKMDQELKAKWLRALRSGRYEQVRMRLRDYISFDSFIANKKPKMGYCCLGVLCNISKRGKWDKKDWYTVGKSKNNNYIPAVLLPEFGITPNTQKELAKMNDNSHLSFKEIANWVEANL